jgi:hypothetical protein
MDATCECDEGSLCEPCSEKEARYWRWYFGASVKTHVESCAALGIPSSSSDDEIMAAAREVK